MPTLTDRKTYLAELEQTRADQDALYKFWYHKREQARRLTATIDFDLADRRMDEIKELRFSLSCAINAVRLQINKVEGKIDTYQERQQQRLAARVLLRKAMATTS